jgi:hypothetical protein
VKAHSEAAVAIAVITELQRQGYTTYQEVCHYGGGQRADIVATLDNLLMVVEVKQSFSLALLDQCTQWIGNAHYVIAAGPFRRRSIAFSRYCRQNGIGMWMVGQEVREEVKPQLFRRATQTIRRALCNEQRAGDYARAGTNGGGYWTPFQATRRALNDHVRRNQGAKLSDSLKAITHHYATMGSAVGALSRLIQRGELPEFRLEGRPLRIYAVEAAK